MMNSIIGMMKLKSSLVKFKGFFIIICSMLVVFCFMGVVSAASLTVDEVAYGSNAVKDHTASHGKIPGYVKINGKNSTTPSFLNTLTKTVVQINQDVETPVTISSVNPAPSPSGSATGTISKSEYITIASNVKSFISSNGRAPNYAVSSKGNIRYESLVYTYARIMDYYRINGQLPSSLNIVNIVGTTGGVNIQDTTRPTVTNVDPANNKIINVADKALVITFSENIKAGSTFTNIKVTNPDGVSVNPLYKVINGKTLTLTRNGYYINGLTYTITLPTGSITDQAGNAITTFTSKFTIDFVKPTVTANLATGVYNTAKSVTLTASDNLDSNPIIYYTTNGNTPTTSSTRYTAPITVNKTTTLKFMARDKGSNQSPVNTRRYIFSKVGNLNTGKGYTSIQAAINDSLTLNGHIIEVLGGTYTENVIVNKKLKIRRAASTGSVTVKASNSSKNVFTINSGGSGSTIQGFTIRDGYNGVSLISANSCSIIGNTITNNGGNGIWIGSDNNVISGNVISNNDWNGVSVTESTGNDLVDNTVSSNTRNGIYVEYGTDTTVSRNTVRNNINYQGIYLYYTDNNTVSGNTVTNNEINGIILNNADNNLVSGNVVSDNGYDGISVCYSNSNNILKNTATNNSRRGIYLGYTSTVGGSNYNIINQNIVEDNDLDGIFLYGSNGNTVSGNTITGNLYNGISLDNSDNNSVSGNTLNSNELSGIILNNADNNSVSGNTGKSNGNNGIFLYYSDGNYISGNTVTNNVLNGISVCYSNSNNILKNTATNNSQRGIYLGYTSTIGGSNYNIINQNNVEDNGEEGIFLYSSNGNTVSGNTVTGNLDDGIFLNNSDNNSVSGNVVSGNGYNGISIVESNGNDLIDNIVTGNNNTGILLQDSDSNTISRNTMRDNDNNGITLLNSDNNIIYRNSIKNNSLCGIFLDNSHSTEITENTITNNYIGVYLNFSPVTVNFNRIFGNSIGGLYNEFSNYVDATNNWWGTNTPNVSLTNGSDIYNLGGNVVYNPWIVLTVDSVYTTNGIYNITADLTKNNKGNDISSLGYIPDGITINFTTDYGTIRSTVNTINGKAISQLNSDTTHNIANVTVSLDNQIVSTTVTIFKIYNTVTHKGFETIQAAIDDPTTSPGDIIEIGSGTYTESIVINKKLTIIPSLGCNVTFQTVTSSTHIIPGDPESPVIIVYEPVFLITSTGSGSTIQGFIINGTITLENANNCSILGNNITAEDGWGIELHDSHNNTINENIITYMWGIYLNYSDNNTITRNILTNNIEGAELYHSNNNTISDNVITNSSHQGIYSQTSSNNIISGNTVTNGNDGIFLSLSGNTIISGNIVRNNIYGIRFYNSSATVNFNSITGNIYGLYNDGNGVIDAINNWWGSNDGPNYESDIYDPSETVTYSPWLVLNVSGEPTVINEESIITADLTHNSNGEDTSSGGHVPDNIPVNFTTTLGTITSTGYIKNGKAISTLNSKTATLGTANITVTLDNQNVQISITIDKIVPTVNTGLTGGFYNTAQYVNLTASDNLDSNPIIYYTLDGSTPTVSSEVYTGPISIGTTTTLKFMAVDSAGNQSPVTTEHYIFLTVGNLNTGKGYSTIQNAIDDPLTVDGDIIVIKTGIYTENIILNKNLTLKPFSDGNVTIQAANSNNPVITINSGGSGSIILGFIVTGASGTSSSGIYLNQASNCTISSNNLTNNYYGLLLTNSTNNTIFNNTLTSNLMEAIKLNSSDDNIIYSNTIINNSGNGIYLYNSQNTLIMTNTIQNNSINGIELNNSSNTTVYQNIITDNQENGIKTTSSSADINFNVITGNSVHGLYSGGNGTINAENNWWGTNNPVVSSSSGSDIYIAGGTVTYDPWLVLSLTGSTIKVTHNSTSDSDITADLTHNNHGDDTSPSGTIPDGLPVDFTTTLGTINSTGTTKNGRSTVKLTSNTSDGATTVTTTLNNQEVSKSFHKSFNSIQAAVSDPLTVDGDVILVTNGTYVENIMINKNLILISDDDVTIQALNPSTPTVTITGCSDVIISGFTIISNGLSALDVSEVTNCYIIDNIITTNGNDTAIYIESATNCTITGNTLLNNLIGIFLVDSDNTLISGNNITNNDKGIYVYASNSINISENTVTNNDVGIPMSGSSNAVITGNNITNNNINGVVLFNSPANVHFNRITGNGQHGLLNSGSSCNATNNWWGTNNPVVSTTTPSDINVHSGTVLYDPWLVLTVTPTSYKVSNGKIYESTITADFNHNSDGEYLSTLIYLPDGIPVNFTTDNGTITNTSTTVKGEASSTLVLNPNLQSGLTNVTAVVDGQSASTTVDRSANAKIHIISTAIDLATGQPLSLYYELPLNESVSWVSVLWKSTSNNFGTFQNEVNLIVNGAVVLNRTVSNLNYLYYKDLYSEKVWYNVNFLNWLFSESTTSNMALQSIINRNPQLQNLTGSELETGILNVIKENNGFTDDEMYVIANYRYFTDYIATYIEYPGDTSKKVTFEDPDTGELIDINFPGNPIFRTSTMIYANGGYYHPYGDSYLYRDAGYEGVRSFAIVTTKVTDDILWYWLEQENKTDSSGNLVYANGPMKAAYGTFLEALLVIYCHDMVADAAAYKYNVTWSRTTPIVVSVCDDVTATYITGEMSHRMGMDVVGDPDNVRAFRFACSSAFSPIEHWINEVLFPSNSTSSLMGSVTLGLGYMMLNGESLEIFESNGYIIIRAVGDNQRLLIIDPVTGIVRDGMTLNETISGNYCFSDLQTEWATDFTESILNYGSNIKNILINGNGTIDLSQLASNTKTGLVGFLSSAMMSLESASMFFADGIPSNSLYTLLGLNIVGLACFNAYTGRYINEIAEGINGETNERRTYVIVNAAGIVSNKSFVERLADGEDMNGPQPTDRYYRPEAIKSGYLGNELTEKFLKGAGLLGGGFVLFISSPLWGPVAEFPAFFGALAITRGLALMGESIDESIN